jgi:hypothetical protein
VDFGDASNDGDGGYVVVPPSILTGVPVSPLPLLAAQTLRDEHEPGGYAGM